MTLSWKLCTLTHLRRPKTIILFLKVLTGGKITLRYEKLYQTKMIINFWKSYNSIFLYTKL